MTWAKFKLVFLSKLLGNAIGSFYRTHVYNCNPKNYLKAGKHIILDRPIYTYPPLIELGSYVSIRANFRAIISPKQKIVIKKFTGIGAGLTVIPGEHTPTVSVPQYLSRFGVNDVNNTLIIGEDVWIGANCTLLHKANIGRGAVIGANSLVTKKVPPYAVVAGNPAKIIAVRFSLEQIIEHEKHLYPVDERLSRKYLEGLFDKEYLNKKTIGISDITPEDSKLLEDAKKRLGIVDHTLE